MQKFVLVFLDDILIYSATRADHLLHIQQVLETLRVQQFYLKASKCTFAKSILEYLGHIISDRGVATDPSKTANMLQWPTPLNSEHSWG
jgi:hypothetical protein